MNRIKLKSYLEVSTRIAILLTTLAVLWLIFGSVLKQPKPLIHVGLRNGDLFPSVAGIDYSKNSKILLISMSTKCASCVESLPFFQKLREKLLAVLTLCVLSPFFLNLKKKSKITSESDT